MCSQNNYDRIHALQCDKIKNHKSIQVIFSPFISWSILNGLTFHQRLTPQGQRKLNPSKPNNSAIRSMASSNTEVVGEQEAKINRTGRGRGTLMHFMSIIQHVEVRMTNADRFRHPASLCESEECWRFSTSSSMSRLGRRMLTDFIIHQVFVRARNAESCQHHPACGG